MSTRPNSPAAKDIAYNLHPYTNARRHEETGPLIVDHGKGVHVYDDQGKDYIEGMGGLWCVALGFGEERLVKAATEQMQRLPYYHSFAQKSHEPSIELSERLLDMAPGDLGKVFYANSGSEANDTVVKLVWYYNNALGRPNKKKIISRIKGYHGVTVASASLTGLPTNHRDFDLPIDGILHTANPHHYHNAFPGESEEEFASRMAGQLEEMILREGPDTVAAFIGEPVMGAGGVIVPPKTYWEKIQRVCRKYDVLVIADEVICGFGRTGEMFGSDVFDINPDFLVVSKQITSAYMPLSAVLMTDQIYQAVADNSAKISTFGHGYTASAHPVATAVALENLKILEERKIVDHVKQVAPRLQDGLRRFADHPLVGEVRGIGLMAAVELVADKEKRSLFDPVGRVGFHLYDVAQKNGLILRNIGDSLAFCPPLIISEDEIDTLLDRFGQALDETYSWSTRTGVAAE